MEFNTHYSNKVGSHAIMSPSSYHWINYDGDKFLTMIANKKAAALGTKIHKYAEDSIRLAIRQRDNETSLSRFVNDAIGFKMEPEVLLRYSDNCFGTADAISFKDDYLRIHDLKTGVSPASMTQLEIYAAIFCLEYKKDPNKIDIELRIYQNDEVTTYTPDPTDIIRIINKIVSFDALVEGFNKGV